MCVGEMQALEHHNGHVYPKGLSLHVQHLAATEVESVPCDFQFSETKSDKTLWDQEF